MTHLQPVQHGDETGSVTSSIPRPCFHFTPKQSWMNDPNGLVFYEGEYHLFYQHHPDSCDIGPMHWGHAVSTDLIHWQHLPIALSPDHYGCIFSGCALVDWHNSSGLGVNGQPPLVALFTYHDAEQKALDPTADCESQGLAYSLDRGRSWIKYPVPVLPNPGNRPDFRDPKVVWDQARHQWVMAVAAGTKIEFYQSENLLSWQYASAFQCDWAANDGVWECPDLFPLSVNALGIDKWVLLVSLNPGGPHGGSGTQYFVGDFDGQAFALDPAFMNRLQDEGPQWLDFGNDNYAGVTWSDVPDQDGRRLFIGWMNNWKYGREVQSSPWRGSMTLPREFRLEFQNQGFYLFSQPVDELDRHLDLSYEAEGDSLTALSVFDNQMSLPVQFVAGDIGVELNCKGNRVPLIFRFENDMGEWFCFMVDLRAQKFEITRGGMGSDRFDALYKAEPVTAPLNLTKTCFDIRFLLDHGSIEIFVCSGQYCITETIHPTAPFNRLWVQGIDDGTKLNKVTMRAFSALAGDTALAPLMSELHAHDR